MLTVNQIEVATEFQLVAEWRLVLVNISNREVRRITLDVKELCHSLNNPDEEYLTALNIVAARTAVEEYKWAREVYLSFDLPVVLVWVSELGKAFLFARDHLRKARYSVIKSIDDSGLLLPPKETLPSLYYTTARFIQNIVLYNNHFTVATGGESGRRNFELHPGWVARMHREMDIDDGKEYIRALRRILSGKFVPVGCKMYAFNNCGTRDPWGILTIDLGFEKGVSVLIWPNKFKVAKNLLNQIYGDDSGCVELDFTGYVV